MIGLSDYEGRTFDARPAREGMNMQIRTFGFQFIVSCTLTALVTVAVHGCASKPTWVNPTRPHANFDADRLECQAKHSRGAMTPGGAVLEIDSLAVAGCILDKGWQSQK